MQFNSITVVDKRKGVKEKKKDKGTSNTNWEKFVLLYNKRTIFGLKSQAREKALIRKESFQMCLLLFYTHITYRLPTMIYKV